MGFNKFSKGLKEYQRELRELSAAAIREEGVSEFGDQPFELNTGDWYADETGIWKHGNNGNIVYACSHPIMPVQRLVSIDTGLVKIKLAYRRGYASKRPWNVITVPSSRISKASDIIALADNGISVTSGDRAQALVDYLRDALDRNQEVIQEVKSVSRMGWNEDGFSPYIGGVEFDSADSFRQIYKAIGTFGEEKTWMEEALASRGYSVTARIVLAASFASVLVEPLGCLPFFVHLWGMDSATGKSVSQMLAASVWGNPTIGGAFFPTFKSTSVGVELMAGFLHSLPLVMDELQLAKDRHGNIVFNVYELASGSGKLRGNKGLGLDYTPKWANCFLTSGETPLVSEQDGAGALNRVLEIECRASEKVIENGRKTADAVKASYGHAGRIFIDRLCTPGCIEYAKAWYENIYTACIQSDTTEKQAMAAALILTADHLATDWIFHDDRALTVEEIGAFLKTKAAVSASERGYDYLCDWVASNASRFRDTVENGEHYGVMQGNMALVNRSIFDRACKEAGISPKAILSHLKSKRLIDVGQKGYTKMKRIDGVPVHCIWLKLPSDEADAYENEELPL